MGMYDRVEVLDIELQPTCVAEHRLSYFQTKDFDCGMDTYYVRYGVLYRRLWQEDRNRIQRQFIVHEEKNELEVHESIIVNKYTWTGSILIYTHCEMCRPVLFTRNTDSTSLFESIQERSPFCEFEFVFKDGIYVNRQIVRQNTREQLVAELEKNGLLVLKDDETLAKRHFILWEKNKSKREYEED